MAHELKREESRLIVQVEGRLDAQAAPALEDDMAAALGGVTDVMFDLEGLEYISSAGLRVLLAAYKLMAKREGTMQVVNVGEDVFLIETVVVCFFKSCTDFIKHILNTITIIHFIYSCTYITSSIFTI